MLVALLGLAIGPAILALGAVDDMKDLLRSSGPFVLWVALIATQSMVWALASWPLLRAFRGHWRKTVDFDGAARRDVILAALMLALLVAAIRSARSSSAGLRR
jgi:hypothetical protein